MMSGYLKNTRIGKELMKTSKTNLPLALAIGLAALALTACDKPEPTAKVAQPATQPAVASNGGADKAGDKHGDLKEGEAGHGEAGSLKLTAEEIETAGIKVDELAAQEISEQLIVPLPSVPIRIASRISRHAYRGALSKFKPISVTKSRPARR
jgi:hypothetical protein